MDGVVSRCKVGLLSCNSLGRLNKRRDTLFLGLNEDSKIGKTFQDCKTLCYVHSSPRTKSYRSSELPRGAEFDRLNYDNGSPIESPSVFEEGTSDSEGSSSDSGGHSQSSRGRTAIQRWKKGEKGGRRSNESLGSVLLNQDSVTVTSRALEKSAMIQNAMARHRTHGLTKTIKQKSPWISYAVDKIRRSVHSKNRVQNVMDDVIDKVDPGATYVILNELQRLHDWKAVVEMAKWLKSQPWHTATERFYNMLIGFLGREGQPEIATTIFQEMLLEQVPPNNYTFTALINAYGRAKMFNEALEVFEYMKTCEDEECRPNAVTCNTLVGVLCRGKRYEKAVEIFGQMKEGSNGICRDACKPSIVTYNTLIDAMCREGKITEAVDVLAELASGQLDSSVVPDTVTYNVIIDACGKAGNAVKAEQLVKDMVELGLKPDKATYTALIDGYGKSGELEKAEATFREMQDSGVKPDVLSYTALISSFGRNLLLDRAEELVQEMKKLRVRPNEVTYLALIDAYGKAGKPKEAELVFKEMVASGHKANVYAYSALMDAFGKSGEYKKMVKVFEQMRREGCRPNLVTYAALLTACGRSKNWEDALVLLYCLQQSGSEWELCMCRLVLGGPEEEKVIWENAAKMFEGMQRFPMGLRRSFYNSLIDTLWNYGLRERGAKVAAVGRMLEVYKEEMFIYASSTNGDHAESEWIVDLHDNSVGSAVTHFYAWLKELRLAWQWQPEVPRKICVVTGWGKHSVRKVGEAPVKSEILAELQRLGGPFYESHENPGRIYASGRMVKKWLLKPGMDKMLELQDTINPRPSGESPYEHL